MAIDLNIFNYVATKGPVTYGGIRQTTPNRSRIYQMSCESVLKTQVKLQTLIKKSAQTQTQIPPLTPFLSSKSLGAEHHSVKRRQARQAAFFGKGNY
jgi:hypothetical protein